ncbi:MAG: hypothetical protein GWP91_13460 [Rhodobacterales bacterium]|nr:hypothetical protein [Rhodobacterales bacterium]
MWWCWIAVALAVGEIPYDGVDQDGDGGDLIDLDGDGYESTLALGMDCNDRDALVNPGTWDAAGDGVDADCDGLDGMHHSPTSAQIWSRAKLFVLPTFAVIGTWWSLFGWRRRGRRPTSGSSRG